MKLSLKTLSWVVGIESDRLNKFQNHIQDYLFSDKYLNKLGLLKIHGSQSGRKIEIESIL